MPFYPPHDFYEPHEPQARAALPVTAHGRLNTTDWIIGTLPDQKSAQRCVEALVDSGFTLDDLLVELAGTALDQLHADEQHERDESPLARIFDTLKEASIDGGEQTRVDDLRVGYVNEARLGRVLIGAHDPSGVQTDRIRNTLVEFGARYIHLFEPTLVRRLD